MDVEASVIERLQKLRQWQIEQQEKLLKQQHIQREILSHKQGHIYKALGLDNLNNIVKNLENINTTQETEMDSKEMMFTASMSRYSIENSDNTSKIIPQGMGMDMDTNAFSEDDKNKEIKDLDFVPVIVDKDENSMKDDSSDVLSEKEELNLNSVIKDAIPLSLNNEKKTLHQHILIDNIPIPSPKKSFQTLLEERLNGESQVAANANTNSKITTKKPFLKKGQGLARFKMSLKSYPLLTMKKQSKLSCNKGHIDATSENKKSVVQKNVLVQSPNNISLSNKKEKEIHKSESTIPVKQAVCNTILNQSKHAPEMNTSDFNAKTQKELEEVRIFELLEEKAENSSFCSTSSTVLAFLQQSTPFKIKKLNHTENENKSMTSTKQNNRKNDIIDWEPMLKQYMHIGNSKLNTQYWLEQFDIHKRNCFATIDPYWDRFVTNDDIQEEGEEEEKRLSIVNQISRNGETHIDHFEDYGITYNQHTPPKMLLDNNKDVLIRNHNLKHDKDMNVNHRVRFSESNEYKTIDLKKTDRSDTSNKSPLEDYYQQADQNNHSIDTSELFEKKSPSNYEKYVSALKVIDNEKIINAAIQLRHDITKNSHYNVMQTFSVPKEENTVNCKEDSLDENNDNEHVSIVEEIVETSDEEESIVSSSSSPSLPSSVSCSIYEEPNTNEKENYILKKKPKPITDEVMEICSDMEEVNRYLHEDRNNIGISKPEFLKNRLSELEKEIDIFRKESAALLLQRQKLQEDQMILHKEYVKKENNFEENKKRIQNQLEEEKKKLLREKIAIENRIRDVQEKAGQSKMEKQMVKELQKQIEKLKDELNVKENKWNITESRYKSELRVLRVEISKLKQEISHLRNSRNIRNIRKKDGPIITEAVDRINKRVVAASSKETLVKMPQNVSTALSDAFIRDNDDNNHDEDKNKIQIKDKSVELGIQSIDINADFHKTEDNISPNKGEFKQSQIESQLIYYEKFKKQKSTKEKRDLDEDLLSKDFTSNLAENQNPSSDATSNLHQPMVTEMRMFKSNSESCLDTANGNFEHLTICPANDTEHYSKYQVNRISSKKDTKTQDRKLSADKSNLCSTLYSSSICCQANSRTNTKDIVKQVQHFDGRIEYWYLNGNVKKIFPDQGMTKMIYYNGDVRETDKDGRVKYFYATTRTWHTTNPNGLEILEYPDGQVEKRTSDGTIEVSFPDGAIRTAQTDGTEKWTLPDGTEIEHLITGDKIFTLPNGQREIHTKAHKRREYPNGTIKLIYADGTQETCYSNGRKRLKDKDGNVLMDSKWMQ